jgi:hypothetical protein
MQSRFILGVLAAGAFLLTGCAASSTASHDDSHSAAISTPEDSSHPPVTLSGYMDTSATVQTK